MGFGHSCLQPQNSSKEAYIAFIDRIYQQVTTQLLVQPSSSPTSSSPSPLPSQLPLPPSKQQNLSTVSCSRPANNIYSTIIRPAILRKGLTNKLIDHLSSHRDRIPAAVKYLLSLKTNVYSLNSQESSEAIKMTVLIVIEEFAHSIASMTEQRNLTSINKKTLEDNRAYFSSSTTNNNSSKTPSGLTSPNNHSFLIQQGSDVQPNKTSSRMFKMVSIIKTKDFSSSSNQNFHMPSFNKKSKNLVNIAESHNNLVKGFQKSMCRMFKFLNSYELNSDELTGLMRSIIRFCHEDGLKFDTETQAEMLEILLHVLLDEKGDKDTECLKGITRLLQKIHPDTSIGVLEDVLSKILTYYEKNSSLFAASPDIEEYIKEVIRHFESFLKESRYVRLYKVIMDLANRDLSNKQVLFLFEFSNLLLFVMLNLLTLDNQILSTSNNLSSMFPLSNYVTLSSNKNFLFYTVIQYIIYGYGTKKDILIMPLRELAGCIILNSTNKSILSEKWVTHLVSAFFKKVSAREHVFVQEFMSVLEECMSILESPDKICLANFPILLGLVQSWKEVLSERLNEDAVDALSSVTLKANTKFDLRVNSSIFELVSIFLNMPKFWVLIQLDQTPIVHLCHTIVSFLKDIKPQDQECETFYSLCQSFISILNSISSHNPNLGFATFQAVNLLHNSETINPEFKFFSCHILAKTSKTLGITLSAFQNYSSVWEQVKFIYSIVSPTNSIQIFFKIKTFEFSPVEIVEGREGANKILDSEVISGYRKGLRTMNFGEWRSDSSIEDKTGQQLAGLRRSTRESQLSLSYESSFASVLQVIRNN